MIWLAIGVIVLGLLMDSDVGKFAIVAGVAALGFLLLDWIFDIALFLTLAKICAGVIVVIIAFLIIHFVWDCFD